MRNINIIAQEIKQNWKNPYFGAIPYLDAMSSLTDLNSNFGFSSAKSIILYFLSNAKTWKGDKAREIKKELKTLIK